MKNDQIVPLNVGSAPLTKDERRKLKKKLEEDPDRPFEISDLNIWRSQRKGYRMVATWLSISVCAIFLYYFGYNMNIIPTDCWYIEAYMNTNPSETLIILNN